MTRDRFLGIFLVGLAIGLGLITRQIEFSSMTGDPGPKLFPYFACSILLLCGLAMLVQPTKAVELPQFDRRYWARTAAVFALLIAYAVMLWTIGFHLSTPIMLFAFYWQMTLKGRFSLLWAIVYSAITYGLIYLFFKGFLGSYLPEGVLF
jgi:putative tricarboxylic transport membrane protein